MSLEAMPVSSARQAFVERAFPDRPDAAAKLWLTSAVVWGALGMSYGLLMATQFVFPEITRGIPQLTLSRVRPTHVNTVVMAWVSMASIGAMFYMLPRLLKTPLWSERLGTITGWSWNLFTVFIPLTLLNGFSEAREWAELIAPLDWWMLANLTLVAVVTFATIANRKEPQLYVSVWYWMGSLIGMSLIWLIGNRTFIALDGLNDAITNWFYAHDVLGLWVTTMSIGVIYYLIPKLTVGPNGEPGNPIYSHKLSLIGFWGNFAFYTGIGAHHIIQAPVPEWLKAFAISSSVLMSIPVYAASANFFLSIQGRWGNLAFNMPLRFLVFGAFNYAIASFQGSLQAVRSINWYQHFTGIVPAHAHLALLGGFSAVLFAAIYYLLPRLYKVEWYSKQLVVVHFWTFTVGFTFFFTIWTVMGFVQAASWNMGINVQQTVPFLYPFLAARDIAAGVMILGVYLFAYNVVQTVRGALRAQAAARLEAAPAIAGAAADD
jgi:cbb3-type cytochrome c oxidase subunit I